MRHWTPRHIAMLWTAALLVQLVIFLPVLLEDWAEARPGATIPVAAAPIDTVMRGRVLEMLRDSLGIELAVRGDTIVSASLNARGDSVLRQTLMSAEHSLVAPFGGLWWALFVAVIATFSPVLIAAVLTLTWWLARGRARAPVAAGDA